VTHISTEISPFEVCYGFQPLAPSEIPVAHPSSSTSHQQKEHDIAPFFVQHLVKIDNRFHGCRQRPGTKHYMTNIELLHIFRLVTEFSFTWTNIDSKINITSSSQASIGFTPSLNKWVPMLSSWIYLRIHDFMDISHISNCMSHLTWRNQFQSHIWGKPFKIFSLLFLKIYLLMSAPDLLGSLRLPLGGPQMHFTHSRQVSVPLSI
jgi:hypothetical protein